jgi:hypothetical protein
VEGRGVRLIGITAINLSETQQLTLFDAAARTERVAESLDLVRGRFGDEAITRARLLVDRNRRRFDFGEKPASPTDEQPEEPPSVGDPDLDE